MLDSKSQCCGREEQNAVQGFAGSKATRPTHVQSTLAITRYNLVETSKASNITPGNGVKALKGMLLLAPPCACTGRQVLKLDTAQRNCRRIVAKAEQLTPARGL
ncbi:unnamed protein product [Symbiodinium necroappetens]|uniref:Uncharacterized protein n=1 Tax=Symbiodinium necroappetens TaxID=1628268 RepID=A0A813BT61_9DINO|nr:unnamed protein product [Symbiodinium necroappetens]